MSTSLIGQSRSVRNASDERPPSRSPAVPGHGRGVWAAACVLLCLHGALCWYGRTPAITTRQDDAAYVLLSRSLGQGHYRDIFRVDAPVHALYPPGYPAILAMERTIVGEGYGRMVAASVLSSVATLLFLFLAVRRTFSPALALASLAVLAVNPYLVEFGGSVASEAPYTALSMLALYLLSRPSVGARGMGLAAAAAIVAALTRSVGATLLIAVALYWLIERRWKALGVFCVAVLLTVGAWTAWTILAPEQFLGKSYIADALATGDGGSWLLPRLVMRIGQRVPFYLGEGLPYTLPLPTVPGTPIDNVIGAGVTALGLAVGAVLLLARWPAAGLYVAVYAALLSVWVWTNERFVVPTLPFVVPAVMAGLWTVTAKVAGRRWAIVPVVLWAVAVVGAAGARTGRLVIANASCAHGRDLPPDDCLKRDQVSFFNAVRFIRGNVADDAVFLSAKPEPLYLYAGIRSVGFGAALDVPPEEFLPRLREAGAEYVLLGSLQSREPRMLAGLMEPVCDRFDLVGEFPARTYLFRLRAPESDDPSAACGAIADYRAANVNRDFERDP